MVCTWGAGDVISPARHSQGIWRASGLHSTPRNALRSIMWPRHPRAKAESQHVPMGSHPSSSNTWVIHIESPRQTVQLPEESPDPKDLDSGSRCTAPFLKDHPGTLHIPSGSWVSSVPLPIAFTSMATRSHDLELSRTWKCASSGT